MVRKIKTSLILLLFVFSALNITVMASNYQMCIGSDCVDARAFGYYANSAASQPGYHSRSMHSASINSGLVSKVEGTTALYYNGVKYNTKTIDKQPSTSLDWETSLIDNSQVGSGKTIRVITRAITRIHFKNGTSDGWSNDFEETIVTK